MALTQVSSAGIKNAEVKTEDILDANVTTAKVADNAITGAKIADDAVGAEHIEVLDSHLQLADSSIIKVGTGDDLQLQHTGSYSKITNTTGDLVVSNTGDLYLQSNDTVSIGDVGANEYSAKFIDNGAVELFYDNSKKLETYANGIQVTGSIKIPDSEMLRIGDDTYGDLKIYHSGSTSWITNNTSYLYLHADDTAAGIVYLGERHFIKNEANTEQIITGYANGAVELYYDNSKKLETTSIGATITSGSGGAVLKVQGAEGGNAEFWLQTDEGDDDADNWLIYHDASDNKLKFASKPGGSYTDKLTIDSSGRVGIGKTPESAVGSVLQTKGNDGISFQIPSESLSTILRPLPSGLGLRVNYQDGSEVMRIDSSGRLLLGTTTEGASAGDTLTIEESGNAGITIRSGTSDSGLIYFSDGTSGTAEYAGFIQYSHGSTNTMYLGAGSGTRMEVRSGGDVKINNGNILMGTSGTGINFSATGDGSSASNVAEVLNDYESGSFTPTVSSGMSSPTYGAQRGGYTKVGKLVNFQIDINISGGSTTGDHLKLGGLPFTSAAAVPYGYGGASINYQGSMFDQGVDVSLHVGQNESVVKFYTWAGGPVYGNGGDVNDITSNLIIHGQYLAG